MIKAEVVDTANIQSNEPVQLLTSATLSRMSQEEMIDVLASNRRIFVPKSMLGPLLSQSGAMLGQTDRKSLDTGEAAPPPARVPSSVEGDILANVQGTSLGTLVGTQNMLPTPQDLITIDPATLELPSTNNNVETFSNDSGEPSIGNTTTDRALILAAKSADYQGLVQALEKGADVVLARDPRCGATALHYVAVAMHRQESDEASPNSTDNSSVQNATGNATGNGALTVTRTEAASSSMVDLFKLGATADEEGCVLTELLLANGADAQASSSNGSTALHWAAGAGNLRAIRSLVRGPPSPSAAASASSTASSTLSGDDTGTNLYARSYTWGRQVFGKGSGQTPLHWAAESGQHEAIALLLSLDTGSGHTGGGVMAGALSLAQDERGQTAQALAEKEGHTLCKEMLKAHEGEEYVCVDFTTEASVVQAAPTQGRAGQSAVE
jgi:hypothetical protein